MTKNHQDLKIHYKYVESLFVWIHFIGLFVRISVEKNEIQF